MIRIGSCLGRDLWRWIWSASSNKASASNLSRGRRCRGSLSFSMHRRKAMDAFMPCASRHRACFSAKARTKVAFLPCDRGELSPMLRRHNPQSKFFM